MSKLPVLLMPLCLAPMLAACSTLAPTVLASKTLEAIPRVHNSAKAPCPLQRQIAAQNTYLASVSGSLPTGTVYAAPCDLKAAVPVI